MARIRSRCLLLGLFVLVMIGLALALWSAAERGSISALKRSAGPLPFFAAMAALPAFGLPITPFFVASGALFGVWIGLLGSITALVANLALCHWIARSVLRGHLRSLMRRFGYKLANFEERAAGALRFTLMVKITPGLPAFAKNYLLGLAGVPLGVYMAGSLLITGVYAVGLVVLGESLLEHDIGRMGIVLAVLLLLAAVLFLWRRARDDRA